MGKFDFKKSRRKGFGVGASNTQILEALYKKYSRDYLRYFKELSDNYKIGPNKEEVDKTVELIKRMLVVLENVITTGIITEEDSERLSEFSENIELQKQFFIQEIQKDTVLQQLLSVINEKTGISLEEMTSVEGVVEKGLQQVRKSQVKRAPFAEKAPRVAALGKELGKGLAVATTGPFYPLLEKAFGVGKDIFSLGKGISQKRREREEESAIAQTFPSSFREPRTREVREARGVGSPLGSMVGIAGKEILDKQVAPLKRFFDKEAYQTKWTKELLEEMKKAGEKSKIESSLGIGNLLALAGKAAIGAGTAAGGLKVGYDLAKAVMDYNKAIDYSHEAHKRAMDSLAQWNRQIDKVTSDLKGGTQETKSATDEILKRMSLRDQLLAAAPTTIRDPFVSKPKKESEIIREKSETISKEIKTVETQRNIFNKEAQPLKIEVPPVPGLDVLKEAIERLTEQLQRNQESAPIKMGNVFDSGDTLLTEHARGNLNFER